MAKPKYIYDGFYTSFSEAAPVELGFSGKRWISSLEERLIDVKNTDWSKQTSLDATLKNVLEGALSQYEGNFRVLDIGGALGATCFWLASVLGEEFERLEYSVVDIPAVIEHANSLELQKSLPGLSFYTEIPEQRFQLANFGSSLHYFESPQKIMNRAAATGADHLVFTRTPINEKGTFVSLQKYYESRIPVTVIGIKDLNAWCGELGYTQLSNSATDEGQEPFPISGVPEEYSTVYASDLVYKKL